MRSVWLWFAPQSSEAFARAIGYPTRRSTICWCFTRCSATPVPDVSLNAVANLGYAECRFLAPVYPGDTLNAVSDVIGLKENSNGETGIVYVRSTGGNQDDRKVLEYVRWVMVRKRDEKAPAPRERARAVGRGGTLQFGQACPRIDLMGYDFALAGGFSRLVHYAVGEHIDHAARRDVGGGRAPDRHPSLSEHGAGPFQPHYESNGRFGRRLISVVSDLARADVVVQGLANAFHIAAINGGRHVSPCLRG